MNFVYKEEKNILFVETQKAHSSLSLQKYFPSNENISCPEVFCRRRPGREDARLPNLFI